MVLLVSFGVLPVAAVMWQLGLECPRWLHSYFCLGRGTWKAEFRWDSGMSRPFHSISPCCLRTFSSPGGLSSQGARFLTWWLRAPKSTKVEVSRLS